MVLDSPENVNHVALSETLRWSYLLTLPFFNTVAVLSNVLIICIFSTKHMKKYRASVFFRFVALVDILNGLLTFGLMWFAVVAAVDDCHISDRILHCKMYTVLRYTAQDLSAWGLVCLVMERCSDSVSCYSRPTCLVITVCKYQWIFRHLSSKIFLFCVSAMTFTINVGMVFAAVHDLEVEAMSECFNSWKSSQDFTYDFRSLAMSHALLSVILPSLSCIVAYLCLRVVMGTRQITRSLRLDHRYGVTNQMVTGVDPWLTHSMWTRLKFSRTGDPLVSCSGQSMENYCGDKNGLSSIAFTLTVPAEPTSEIPRAVASDTVLDRLNSMIKFVLSVMQVEDTRLVAEAPQDLKQDFNAMASVGALFYVLLMQPQILYLSVGCILRHSSDWILMKNIGLAVDLVCNNRINFTLFLYIIVSGKRVTNTLMHIIASLAVTVCPRQRSHCVPRCLRLLLEAFDFGHVAPDSPPPGSLPASQDRVGEQGRSPCRQPDDENGSPLESQNQQEASEEGQGDHVVPTISIMTPC